MTSTDSVEQPSRDEWVSFMETLYVAAFRCDDGFGSVDPSYTFAVQQLCSEIVLFTDDLDEDASRRALQAAQERRYGALRGEESASLAEFGVTIE